MREIAITIKEVGQPLKTKQHSCIFFTLTVRKSYVFLKGKFHQKRNLGKKKKLRLCSRNEESEHSQGSDSCGTHSMRTNKLPK